MRKIAFVMLFSVSVGWCQTPTKEADTLQSLLAEVHQLRQAIEAMTVTSQRVQIALHALQMQDAAVTRSTQRLDEIQKRCSASEAEQQRVAGVMQRLETQLSSGTASERETKEIRAALPDLKNTSDARMMEIQACQASEAEAAGQLRNDRAKLADLQDRIERLDKSLEKQSSAGK